MMFSPDTYDGFGQSDSESLESDRYDDKFDDKIALREPIKYDLIEYSQEESVVQDESSFLHPQFTNTDFQKSLVTVQEAEDEVKFTGATVIKLEEVVE